MGWLQEGTYLSWEETEQIGDTVKRRAAKQFVNYFTGLNGADRGFTLKFGDEMEYIIVKFDHRNLKARVSLKAYQLLERIDHRTNDENLLTECSIWMPEYAGYMLEGTPKDPYEGLLFGGDGPVKIIEGNLKQRRREVQALLADDELLLSISTFPRLGCDGFSWPIYAPNHRKSITGSLFLPDEIIYPHTRYSILTRDMMRHRRGKVTINVPIFKDIDTASNFQEDHTIILRYAADKNKAANHASLPGHIYMDAMAFGLGNCCLQITLQAYCLEEARILYDQLATFCPIMLALTAASPVFRGYLTEIDSQWHVTSKAMDCRSEEEKGLKPLTDGKYRIAKSRYDSVSLYLSEEGQRLNVIHAPCDIETYRTLRNAGIDHWLSQHIAFHFVRRPIGLVKEHIEQDDDQRDIRLFQTLYMANYLSMRLKIPSPESNIGWRVEFRPCETQITDFENAAVICFVMLLSRTILSYKLNFLLPINKVDENMKIAEKKDAVILEKFWMRENIRSTTNPQRGLYEEPISIRLTIDEIINGKDEFPGLVPLIKSYVSNMELDPATYTTFTTYLDYIKRKSVGTIPTVANWMRKFIRAHPAYRFDSVVTDEINYDLLSAIGKIQDGKVYESYVTSTYKRTPADW